MNVLNAEQEGIVKLITARVRREFLKFNETVKPYKLRLLDLWDNLARGNYHHDQSRVLQECADLCGVAYDAMKPTIPFDELRDPREETYRRDLTSSDTSLYSAADVLDRGDIFRPFSITQQLGIEVASGLEGNTVCPTESNPSTAYWLATQATAATVSQPTFVAKTMTPHQVAIVIPFSRQLLKQGNGEAVVRNELRRTAATELDRVVLQGTTPNSEPLGLVNTAGVQTMSGTSLTGASANQAFELATIQNAPDASVAALATPTVRRVLQNRETGTNNGFIWKDGRISDHVGMVSTLVPSGGLIVGPFSSIVLGVWGGFQVEIDPFTSFRSGVVSARIILSVDVCIRRPSAFVYINSVT
jgi:capsid protein